MDVTIHGICIENKQLLMVQKGKWYILHGGKREEGELDKKCLQREVKEELSGSEIFVGNYYKTFFGITPNSRKPLISKNYFIYFKDNIGNPSAEISCKKFVTSKNKSFLDLTEISLKVLDSLIKEGLVN